MQCSINNAFVAKVKGGSKLNLQIEIENDGPDTTSLRVSGEVDVFTAPKLKTAIDDSLAKGIKRLVIHLNDVEYFDSTGLGVLISTLKTLQEQQGTMILIGPTQRTLRLFDLTGVSKIFTIYDNIDEANAHETVSVP